eukprot:GFYU01013988.1.p1 GENE.GFYU01013988.1~~GFYU01013988.1.p1  ORF type:complete len:484 (-),score=148.01 GFYU01013988.1:24-1433(-)
MDLTLASWTLLSLVPAFVSLFCYRSQSGSKKDPYKVTAVIALSFAITTLTPAFEVMDACTHKRDDGGLMYHVQHGTSEAMSVHAYVIMCTVPLLFYDSIAVGWSIAITYFASLVMAVTGDDFFLQSYMLHQSSVPLLAMMAIMVLDPYVLPVLARISRVIDRVRNFFKFYWRVFKNMVSRQFNSCLVYVGFKDAPSDKSMSDALLNVRSVQDQMEVEMIDRDAIAKMLEEGMQAEMQRVNKKPEKKKSIFSRLSLTKKEKEVERQDPIPIVNSAKYKEEQARRQERRAERQARLERGEDVSTASESESEVDESEGGLNLVPTVATDRFQEDMDAVMAEWKKSTQKQLESMQADAERSKVTAEEVNRLEKEREQKPLQGKKSVFQRLGFGGRGSNVPSTMQKSGSLRRMPSEDQVGTSVSASQDGYAHEESHLMAPPVSDGLGGDVSQHSETSGYVTADSEGDESVSLKK